MQKEPCIGLFAPVYTKITSFIFAVALPCNVPCCAPRAQSRLPTAASESCGEMVLMLRPPEQVREQDVKLERNIARLEALSFAHISAKAALTTASRTGNVPCLTHPVMPHGAAPATRGTEHEGQDECVPPEHALRENLSVAHSFYRELRGFANSNSSSTQPLLTSNPADKGHGSATSARCDTGAGAGADDAQGGLLMALHRAVADAEAENLSLARAATGFRCSFTTRCRGVCARVHVEDGGKGAAMSSDMAQLAGACERAVSLYAAGCPAYKVVREALWPALSKHTC